MSGKIIDYAEKKHEAHIKGYFAKVYGTNAVIYNARLDKAIADGIERLRRTGVRDCDLFICHSSADADEAKKLVSALENAGLTCWLSEINLLPGTQNYEEELACAIEHCRMMLFLSSANSIYSKECEKELRMANADGKLFFVVKLDKEPFYGTSRNVLSSVQWLNAFDGVTPHCDEIASEIKLAFEDDAKEKAELERRALEARKRNEEAINSQSAKHVVSASNRSVNSAEVFLVQIKECTKTHSDFVKNEKKVNSLIDRGLELNPNDSNLWYWKFLVDVFNKKRDVRETPELGFLEWYNFKEKFENKADEAFYKRVDGYCDDIKEIDPEYMKDDVCSELEEGINLDYDEYLNYARKIEQWSELKNYDLEEYIITKIASRMPDVLESEYYKRAKDKATGEQLKYIESVVERAKTASENIQSDCVSGYSEAIYDQNKELVAQQNQKLDRIKYEYENNKAYQYDSQLKDLISQMRVYSNRLNDPNSDNEIERKEENDMYEKERARLLAQIKSDKDNLSKYEHSVKANRAKNAFIFGLNPIIFIIKAIISAFLVAVTPACFIVFCIGFLIGCLIGAATGGDPTDMAGAFAPLIIKPVSCIPTLWKEWRFLTIHSNRENCNEIIRIKQRLQGEENEMDVTTNKHNIKINSIVSDRGIREERYKKEIAILEEKMQRISNLQAQIPDILSRIEHNKKELAFHFDPMTAYLTCSMDAS